MNLGGTVQLDDVAATMVDAKHSAAAQDEAGSHYVGVAAGFVLTIADGPVLYHAGDTAVFGDMNLIRDSIGPVWPCCPLAATSPWGRKKPRWPPACGSRGVLPLHFGTFPPLKGTPEQLAALVEAGAFRVVSWKPAEEYLG